MMELQLKVQLSDNDLQLLRKRLLLPMHHVPLTREDVRTYLKTIIDTHMLTLMAVEKNDPTT